MVNKSLTQILDNLLARSHIDDAARAELNRIINERIYSANPDEEATRWLVKLMTDSLPDQVRKMALEDQNEMQKKCAGLALVQQALLLPTSHERVDELMEIVRTPGYHTDARVDAVRALDVELESITGGMDKMRRMKLLLLDLGGAPQPLKEAVADAFVDCALTAGGNIYTVKEMVLSGEYGATGERIGIKLVDYLLGKKNDEEVALIADHERAPYNVAAYACAKLGRQISRPRQVQDTLTGMGRAALQEWIAKGGADMEKAAANGGVQNGGKPKVPIKH
jgi:hypothetical protein